MLSASKNGRKVHALVLKESVDNHKIDGPRPSQEKAPYAHKIELPLASGAKLTLRFFSDREQRWIFAYDYVGERAPGTAPTVANDVRLTANYADGLLTSPIVLSMHVIVPARLGQRSFAGVDISPGAKTYLEFTYERATDGFRLVEICKGARERLRFDQPGLALVRPIKFPFPVPVDLDRPLGASDHPAGARVMITPGCSVTRVLRDTACEARRPRRRANTAQRLGTCEGASSARRLLVGDSVQNPPSKTTSYPAQIVFLEVEDVAGPRKWVGRLLRRGACVDDVAWKGGAARPRVVTWTPRFDIVEDPTTRQCTVTMNGGSSPSSLHYARYADVTAAQKAGVRWAGRRFRIRNVPR
jgi:hypothetical protein